MSNSFNPLKDYFIITVEQVGVTHLSSEEIKKHIKDYGSFRFCDKAETNIYQQKVNALDLQQVIRATNGEKLDKTKTLKILEVITKLSKFVKHAHTAEQKDYWLYTDTQKVISELTYEVNFK